MERYCGSLRPAIKSRRHPFRSIDRYVIEKAQLTQIKLTYGLQDDILLLDDNHSSDDFEENEGAAVAATMPVNHSRVSSYGHKSCE